MPTPEAITLAIETSNPSAAEPGDAHGAAGVALGRSGASGAHLLGVERLRPTGRHDDDLMPAIDRLTGRAGVRPGDLTRVAVSIGPGGYTALRIAVATAKLIAEATGAACVAVPSAMVVARRVEAGGRAFAVALASKNDSTHITRFDEQGRPDLPGRLITATDLGGLNVGLLIADRFLPEPIAAAAREAGVEVRRPVFDPSACFEVSLGLPAVDPAALLPHYAREPDAVTQWRARGGRG